MVLQHANRLKKRGYNVVLIHTKEQTEFDWFPGNEVNCHSIFNLPDKIRENIGTIIATGWETAYSAIYHELKADRYIYFVQSDESRFFPEEYIERKLSYASYFLPYEYLTEARWIRDWLKDEFNQEAVYVPNALDPDIIYQTHPIEPKNPRKLRVLLEGAIDVPFKGMDDAFMAVRDLDVEVWCVSNNGVPREDQKCDRFFYKIPFNEMKSIYSSCDVLLKLSRVEGFYGPPLEMMACGGAVVTSKVTGYDEYIVDNHNALTVELGDWKAAKSHLVTLMHDKQLLDTLIENGKKTANSLRWDKTIDILQNYLEENREKKRELPFSSRSASCFANTIASITEKLYIDTSRGIDVGDIMWVIFWKNKHINDLKKEILTLSRNKKLRINIKLAKSWGRLKLVLNKFLAHQKF